MSMVLKVLFFLLPTLALASEGAHHSEGVPTSVLYQAINITILIVGLVYFTKDSVKDFFVSRRAEYVEAAKKSASAREEAEKEFQDIKRKIAELDSTREASLKKAQAHAEDLKKQINEEASTLSKRIREESKLTVDLEVQRAQRELRTKLLNDSIEAARIVLTKDLSNGDQQKLQKDFINNIGV